MRFTLLFLLALALTAGEAPTPISASTTKVDAAYRAYLTAMAKAHQVELAKLDATLKKETNAAKKDATLASAIEQILARVKSGKALDDIVDRGAGGVMDAEKVAGGVEALYGNWTLTPRAQSGAFKWTMAIRPKGVAYIVNDTPDSKRTSTHTWTITNGNFRIEDLGVTWVIKLPLPADGTVMAERSAGDAASTVTETRRFHRLPDDEVLPGVK